MFPFVRSWATPMNPPRLEMWMKDNTGVFIPWERIIAFAVDGESE